jgi:phage gp29-like protein
VIAKIKSQKRVVSETARFLQIIFRKIFGIIIVFKFKKKTIQQNADLATRQAQEIMSRINLHLPDPDTILKAQNAGTIAYKDLLNDPHVSAVFEKRKSGVQNLEYELQNENCSPEVMKFFENYLKSIDLYALIDNILNCVFYGFQPFVLQWEYSDGLYIPRIEDRSQQYFYYDTRNQLRIRNMGGALDGSLADPLSFSVSRNKPTYTNPYGEKLASKIFWSVMFKKGGTKFWLNMTEKYGMPFLFGKTPKATTQEKREDFLEMLTNMVQNGVAVINKEDAVDFLEAAGKGDSSNLYQSLIKHCNQEITKAFLTVSNTTEQQQTGTYAAALVQQDGKKQSTSPMPT